MKPRFYCMECVLWRMGNSWHTDFNSDFVAVADGYCEKKKKSKSSDRPYCKHFLHNNKSDCGFIAGFENDKLICASKGLLDFLEGKNK